MMHDGFLCCVLIIFLEMLGCSLMHEDGKSLRSKGVA